MKDTISEFARECSQATRIIVRHPRFFVITVLVLSLGIGMSTALFSVMYGVENGLHLVGREGIDVGDSVLRQFRDGLDESLSRYAFVYRAAILALAYVIHETEKDFFDRASCEALEIEGAQRFAGPIDSRVGQEVEKVGACDARRAHSLCSGATPACRCRDILRHRAAEAGAVSAARCSEA